MLNLAGGLKSNVVDVAFLSLDEFSSGLPAEVVLDPGTLVVYQMNGQVLPREHGYPARLLVPGQVRHEKPEVAGRHSRAGPAVRRLVSAARLDPRRDHQDHVADRPAHRRASLPAGQQRVAGVAYAGDRGISQVELSADGGSTWQTASILEPAAGPDAMVRWEGTFQMGSTPVTLVVRATDGTGVVQPEDFGLPAPDGGWGQDSITVQPG